MFVKAVLPSSSKVDMHLIDWFHLWSALLFFDFISETEKNEEQSNYRAKWRKMIRQEYVVVSIYSSHQSLG